VGSSDDIAVTNHDVEGRRIAVRARKGSLPGLFWLGGFKSDMKGTKAVALDAFAAEHGRACVRFDYSGHGESGGEFTEGTIGRWLGESLSVFDAFCSGPQIVVGSSMGGWIGLLLAKALAKRAHDPEKWKPVFGQDHAQEKTARATLAGLVLIAPAPDFTEDLMWNEMTPEIRDEIMRTGQWERPSAYGEAPYPITRALIEDGRNNLVLRSSIEIGCPVRILQGVQDPDVPWQHAFKLTERLPQDDVVLTLIQDGDHRLSRPQDIARLIATVQEF
jgi:pimeloyl-ACP methyl ester carboxylesterase